MENNDQLRPGSRPIAARLLAAGLAGTVSAALLAVPAHASPEAVAHYYAAAGELNVKPVSGDFNGDGRADIALTGIAGSTIPVAFSSGEPLYEDFTVTDHEIGDFQMWVQRERRVQTISVDVDGDGKDDIVAAGGKDWTTVVVAFSNGDGTFRVTDNYVENIPIWARYNGVKLAGGDFNGDGRGDIALAGGSGWKSIPMGFSNGDGSFSVTNEEHKDFPRWAYERGPQTKLLTGDFNGDGRTDFALCGISNWREFPIAFSNGDGTVNVVSRPAGGISKWSSNGYAEVLTGDFNSDGYDDVAITGVPGWGTVPLVFSNGDGTFNDVNDKDSWRFTEKAAFNNSKGRVLAGEFSGEGGTDLALVDQRSTNTITFGRYTGFESFYPYTNNMK